MDLQSKDLPTNETKNSNEDLNEPSLQFHIRGEVVPPAPSAYNAPSRVAPSACDAPSGDALSVCNNITVDNQTQAQSKRMRVTRLTPNRLVNLSNL